MFGNLCRVGCVLYYRAEDFPVWLLAADWALCRILLRYTRAWWFLHGVLPISTSSNWYGYKLHVDALNYIAVYPFWQPALSPLNPCTRIYIAKQIGSPRAHDNQSLAAASSVNYRSGHCPDLLNSAIAKQCNLFWISCSLEGFLYVKIRIAAAQSVQNIYMNIPLIIWAPSHTTHCKCVWE